MDKGQEPVAGKRKKSGHVRHKPCAVCGDHARSFHFGGLSCDSCKAFFRRAVQHEAHRQYTCAFDGSCEMTVLKRKCCQKCRYEKCCRIGMEPGWVLTEEERKRMKEKQSHKRVQEVQPSKHVELTPYKPDAKRLPEFLNREEQEAIQELMETVAESIRQYPFSEQTKGHKATHMFGKLILRCDHMVRMLSSFSALLPEDQRILIRAGVLEICFLMGALVYDKENDYYVISQYLPDTNTTVLVSLKMEELKKIMSPKLIEVNMRFIQGVQALEADQHTIMLLGLLVIFCPERTGLREPAHVSACQDKYILILKKYMEWRYGCSRASLLFPKLLTKLSDLQELSDLHTEDNVCLGPGDVEELQEAFGRLDINPYTQFDICKYKARPGLSNERNGMSSGVIEVVGKEYSQYFQLDETLLTRIKSVFRQRDNYFLNAIEQDKTSTQPLESENALQIVPSVSNDGIDGSDNQYDISPANSIGLLDTFDVCDMISQWDSSGLPDIGMCERVAQCDSDGLLDGVGISDSIGLGDSNSQSDTIGICSSAGQFDGVRQTDSTTSASEAFQNLDLGGVNEDMALLLCSQDGILPEDSSLPSSSLVDSFLNLGNGNSEETNSFSISPLPAASPDGQHEQHGASDAVNEEYSPDNSSLFTFDMSENIDEGHQLSDDANDFHDSTGLFSEPITFQDIDFLNDDLSWVGDLYLPDLSLFSEDV